MKFCRIAIAGVFLFLQFSAEAFQATAKAGEKWKAIELKHLTQTSDDRMMRVVQLVKKLAGENVEIYHDPVLKVFMIRGPDEQVALAEKLFERFDVAPVKSERPAAKQITVTIHLVEASKEAPGDTMLPAGLATAAKQLTETLGYQRVRLLDTVLLQGQEHSESALSGLLPVSATRTNEKHFYSAKYASARYSATDKTVYLDHFRFEIRIPVSAGGNVIYGESSLQSDLSIRAGQTLVLGKLSMDHATAGADRGVFLMVTAKAE